MTKRETTRDKIIQAINAPLGFFVLALLIVESFLAAVLLGGRLSAEDTMRGLWIGVCIFVVVLAATSVLVWFKPHHLTFDKEAHLRQAAQQNQPTPSTALAQIAEGSPEVIAETKPATTPATDKPRHTADELIELLGNDEYVLDVERRFGGALEEWGILRNQKDATRLLLRHAVYWNVLCDFEQIFGIIFQSQIDLLRRVNGAPATPAEMEEFYRTNVIPRHPVFFSERPWERWLSYLSGQALVEEREDGTIGITMKGRSFLFFLVKQAKVERTF